MTNKESAKIIKGMIVRMREDGTLNNGDEVQAMERAIYVLENPDCCSCDYFVADEIYNDETGDEFDASYCDRKNMEK